MRRGAPGPVLVVAATFLLAAPALGQGGPGRLNLELSAATIAFPTPGTVDFDAGWIHHPGLELTVTSRPTTLPWEVRLRADADYMSGTDKEVGDLFWRTDATDWTAVTGSDDRLAEGLGDVTVTVYFRLRLEWESDSPDTYAVGLTFTAVRP